MEASKYVTSTPLSLTGNAVRIAAANILWAGSQWLAVLLILKLCGASALGDYILGLAIAQPIMLVFSLQLKTIQATDAQGAVPPRTAITLTYSGAALGLALICVGLLGLNYSAHISGVIILIAAAKGTENLSQTLQGYLQRAERLDLIAHSTLIKGPLFLLSLALGLSFSPDSLSIGFALLFTQLVCLLGFDLRNFRRIRQTAEPSHEASAPVTHRKLLLMALPLSLSGLLGTLYINVPRYFVEFYLGRDALGFFAALVSTLRIGTTLTAALLQAASPRLAKLYANDIYAYKSLLLRLLLFVLLQGGLGIGIAYFGRERLLSFLFTPEFVMLKDEFLLLMVSATVLYVFSVSTFGLLAAQAFKADFAIRFGAFLASILLCVLLIPPYGILGGVLTLGLGAAGKAVASGLVLYRLLKTRLETEINPPSHLEASTPSLAINR